MNNNIDAILISEEDIKNKVNELGKRINEDYKGKDLLLVGVLKGSMVFMSDLMRAINMNVKIDFMCVSSYGASTKSSGQVRILMDLRSPIENIDVLIIEDILDSGVTLSYLTEVLNTRNPKSIEICTLLDKPSRRKANVNLKYRGFSIPDEFVVGYGLDYNEDYRNLPYIGVLKTEVYTI
ncbi:MAG: hypoxanthine phosphoribosyltransferase [Clostridiales bacterium GWF2_38_85]|nr:MAG: hypoxanthine phosphoribosyltransferase [Clostridiales bacterium GWF2_38_85]